MMTAHAWRLRLPVHGRAAVPEAQRMEAGRLECQWQRAQLPDAIRDLVLDDQRLRNEFCWYVFEC